jgi:hypothetical protein
VNHLLTLTAVIEAGAGVALMCHPSATVALLLGSGLDTSAAVTVGRVTGGGQQMLEYTQAGDGARLMMLVHHDDAKREYAYGPESKVGTFTDALMAEAKPRGSVEISIKKDWKRIFAFEQ